jgi:hypothetical protein
MKRGKVVWLVASYYHKQMTYHCLWLIIIWLWLMRKMSINILIKFRLRPHYTESVHKGIENNGINYT